MSGAEGLVIGAVIGFLTNLLTKGIDPLLQGVKAARRCELECRRLKASVKSIQTDVQHILNQFEELERYDASAKHDLRVVVKSVDALMGELELARIDVHECESASDLGKVFGSFGGDSTLSKRITERNERITGHARVLGEVNLSLTARLEARRHSVGAHQHQVSPNLQQPHQMLLHQPSLDLQKFHRDLDDIREREDRTRHSQRLERENSVHSACSSHGSSPFISDNWNHHAFQHLNHDTDHSTLNRRHTIASTHRHDIPDFHRSSTVPRSDHATHSEGAHDSEPDRKQICKAIQFNIRT